MSIASKFSFFLFLRSFFGLKIFGYQVFIISDPFFQFNSQIDKYFFAISGFNLQ